jgi:BMFP domain-containing protein YqiC
MKKEKTNKSEDGLARMLNNGFQATQDLFIKKFDQMEKKIDQKFDQVNENFKQVNEKIDNISLNIVDIVRKEEFDKLENRINSLETISMHIPKK